MSDDTSCGAVCEATVLTLNFLADPGHGWLEVRVMHLRELDIHTQVSAYSYLSSDGTMAYLEEDCDAPLYLRTCREAGLEVRVREHHSDHDSFIRRLPGYATTDPLGTNP